MTLGRVGSNFRVVKLLVCSMAGENTPSSTTICVKDAKDASSWMG